MSFDKVAVIPSVGIGDGLIMMVAAHRLLTFGYHVDTFSAPLIQLKDWFVGHHFHERPSIEDAERVLSEYDLIVFQNDNSKFAKHLSHLYNNNKIRALSIFYPSYEVGKHAPLRPLDRVFNNTTTMVDNTSHAISSILGLKNTSKNNGMMPPKPLQNRKHSRRILIHPTSANPSKQWCPKKFIKLGNLLEKDNFEVFFTLSPKERSIWKSFVDEEKMPLFETLSDLAAFAFESAFLIGNDSATGHLCSNFQMPTLIIAKEIKQITQWRPGWYKGGILTPPRWIPNFKGSRLRDNKWQNFISAKTAFKHFKRLYIRDFRSIT